MDIETLQMLWFLVFAVVVAGYCMLDGFDLGVGMLHLTARSDHERRIYLNSIGPVWDGNEVWLIVAGGALFAGFPYAYATLFSAFYLPLTFLLFALIFRAVAIEFRSKIENKNWRKMWDWIFFFGSFLIAFSLGVVLGHFIQGLPINESYHFVKEEFRFFQAYPILVGCLSVSLFLVHGALYLFLKTEETIQENIKEKINPLIITFVILYATVTMTTLIYYPHMTQRIKEQPLFFVLALLNMLSIANIPRCVHHKQEHLAFASSCSSIFLLVSLYALGTFPNLVRSTINPLANSLTIHNASSSAATLINLLIIVAIGVPLVVAYTFIIYRFFSGKVKLDSMSY